MKQPPDEFHIVFENGLFVAAFEDPKAAEKLRADRQAHSDRFGRGWKLEVKPYRQSVRV